MFGATYKPVAMGNLFRWYNRGLVGVAGCWTHQSSLFTVTVLLVAYLDDSGTNKQSPVVTIAGYAAHSSEWAAFERESLAVLSRYEVPLLHTKEFHDRDGAFSEWTNIKKNTFAVELYQVAQRNVMIGASVSAQKRTYVLRGLETGYNQNTSAIGHCFNILVDRMLRSPVIGPHIRADGISFVVENGNKNNGDLKRIFELVRSIHKLEKELHSIRFADKSHCVAIQLADFLAFYSRRHAVKCDEAQASLVPTGILDLVARSLPHDGFVATDFQ
jgi:hypothetical protein